MFKLTRFGSPTLSHGEHLVCSGDIRCEAGCSQAAERCKTFSALTFFRLCAPFLASAVRQQQPAVSAMGEQGNVITIQTSEEWEAKLDEAQKERKFIVVDFTATWCGPCRQMAPFFVELSKKHIDLIYLKVDVDQLHEVAAQWEVQAMPTFVFIKDRKLVHKIVGSNKDELEKKSVLFSASP